MTFLGRLEETLGRDLVYARPSSSALERYRGRLPDGLIDLWISDGLFSLGNGFIWFVDPASYEGTIREWLPQSDLIAFGHNSFGDLMLCDSQQSVHVLHVHYGRVTKSAAPAPRYIRLTLSRESYMKEVFDWDLHKAAVSSVGPLSSEEMYTFVPALALGGTSDVRNVRREELFPQLSILAQVHGPLSLET